jgi:hypothetical protein
MKNLKNVMEIHEVYLQVLDICSIIYSANGIRILPMYAAIVTHRLWPWPVELALEGTVVYWSFTFPHKRKSHGVRSGYLGGQGVGSARRFEAF